MRLSGLFKLTNKTHICSLFVIMNAVTDMALVAQLRPQQRGVFSKSDLQSLLAERHPAAFTRRLATLQRHKALQRFARGWYVTPGTFDLATLSQRVAPQSYISFAAVLARALVVGPVPQREIWAVKRGRSRTYRAGGFRLVHLGVADHLFFGFNVEDGVRWATPEKAFLDVLSFHLHGMRYPFDIYSDLSLDQLDQRRIEEYLAQYRNPKLVAFVHGVMRAQT